MAIADNRLFGGFLTETLLDDLHNEVHIWLADPADFAMPSMLHNLEEVLDANERARVAAFYRDTDRHLYRLAHGALRYLLTAYGGEEPRLWRFAAGPHGKPALAEVGATSNLQFSLSHTAGMVAWSFSCNRACGIDVERIRDDLAIESLLPSLL